MSKNISRRPFPFILRGELEEAITQAKFIRDHVCPPEDLEPGIIGPKEAIDGRIIEPLRRVLVALAEIRKNTEVQRANSDRDIARTLSFLDGNH